MPQGIQDNNVQKVDLIFTKRGRFLKSINSDSLRITKFALSDDGVDYSLYQPNLPEEEKSIKILRTPQLESFTSETGLMRNKLISLERDTTETTKMEVSPEVIEFEVDPNSTQKVMVESITIRAGFPAPNGYVVSLDNADYVYVNNPPDTEIDDEDDDDTPPPDDSEPRIPRNDGSGGDDRRRGDLDLPPDDSEPTRTTRTGGSGGRTSTDEDRSILGTDNNLFDPRFT